MRGPKMHPVPGLLRCGHEGIVRPAFELHSRPGGAALCHLQLCICAPQLLIPAQSFGWSTSVSRCQERTSYLYIASGLPKAFESVAY